MSSNFADFDKDLFFLFFFFPKSNVPDNYKILFMQGGGTGMFAAIPMNIMNTGSADYIVTGER
jgi:hypothetical protein